MAKKKNPFTAKPKKSSKKSPFKKEESNYIDWIKYALAAGLSLFTANYLYKYYKGKSMKLPDELNAMPIEFPENIYEGPALPQENRLVPYRKDEEQHLSESMLSGLSRRIRPVFNLSLPNILGFAADRISGRSGVSDVDFDNRSVIIHPKEEANYDLDADLADEPTTFADKVKSHVEMLGRIIPMEYRTPRKIANVFTGKKGYIDDSITRELGKLYNVVLRDMPQLGIDELGRKLKPIVARNNAIQYLTDAGKRAFAPRSGPKIRSPEQPKGKVTKKRK